MIAYCGLDCFKCEAYLATQSGDRKRIEETAQKWSAMVHADVKPEHVLCDGCLAEGRKSYYCSNLCKICTCCVSKKLKSCAECDTYPCKEITSILDNSPEAKATIEQLRKA